VPEPHRPTSYSFGDNALAADRLALVASVFEPTSARLLADVAPTRVDVAVDLGCGPGHTTRLVAEHTRAKRTVGLDASPAFIERAQTDVPPAIEFVVHDVTRTPFPVPPASLIHARFLLAHLADPISLIERWCTQLAPGGRFVTDETETIETEVEVFALYEATARSMVSHRGADLQVGSVTRDLDPPSGTTVVRSEMVEVRPSTSVVARLYGMNLATWRHDPFVVDNVSSRVIERITRGLGELQKSSATNELAFCNRQVVYERER
jgi:SAM-dependent methyltransferase